MASPEVLPLLRNSGCVPSAIIAGGWCRDGFNGDHAKDIDVFIASAEYDAALSFRARGYDVRMPEQSPGLDALDLLDALDKVDP